MSKMDRIDKYYESFSGTDTLAFIIIPGAKPILLGSLTTISYSMFRVKKPINVIGKVNVAGFTRGVRTIAGTLIFSLLNQHWVHELLDQVPWIKKSFGEVKADELPIFDVMILASNEYGSGICGYIYGIDITDEGQINSIEDLFIENTYSFIARDIDLMKDVDGINKDYTILEKAAHDDIYEKAKLDEYGDRFQWLNYSRIIEKEYPGVDYREGVKQFQKEQGLVVTGFVDTCTSNLLMSTFTRCINVADKEGIYIYDDVNLSKVIGHAKYSDELFVLEEYENCLYTTNGYVEKPVSNVVVIEEVESYTISDLYNSNTLIYIEGLAKVTVLSYKAGELVKDRSLEVNSSICLNRFSDMFYIENIGFVDYIEFIKVCQGEVTKYKVRVVS